MENLCRQTLDLVSQTFHLAEGLECNGAKEDRKARADYIAERSKIIKPLEKQLAKLEEDIAKAEALGGELEAKLVTASESGDGNAITAIAKDMDDNKKKVDQLYEDWERVSAELEAAKDKWKL